jgi:hypothetical protein
LTGFGDGFAEALVTSAFFRVGLGIGFGVVFGFGVGLALAFGGAVAGNVDFGVGDDSSISLFAAVTTVFSSSASSSFTGSTSVACFGAGDG